MQIVRGRHGQFIVPDHDVYVGRSLSALGEYSEGEVEVFRALVKPHHRVIEIGANLGAHTIPLARLANMVFAFEPQRLLLQALCGSVALNGLVNVDAKCAAIGAHAGFTRIPNLNVAASNNFGALPAFGHSSGEEVPVETLDNLPPAHFVKIDVEGAECDVIEGGRSYLKAHRPALYVENDRPENSPRLIGMIIELGYDLWWHVPPLYRPNNYNQAADPWDRNFCSFNMLGLPKEIPSNVDLRPVKLGDTHLDVMR
jgi:FkbM family methyltransferase